VSGINCRAQLKDECYPDQALTVWCLLLPESVSWNVRNPTAGARITGHSSSSVLGRQVKQACDSQLLGRRLNHQVLAKMMEA
jgi:hypothetical protein